MGCLSVSWRRLVFTANRKLLSDLFDLELDATCIYCDNHSCVKLLENPVFHDKSKHIEIKYNYIRDMVHKGEVKF